MEGLIPFVYRAIMQHKNGNEGLLDSWLNDSPSSSYMRLPTGDSGRFQASDIRLFGSDYSFSATTSTANNSTTPSNMNTSSSSSSTTTTQILVSTGAQSPLCRLTPRRVAT